MIYLTLGIFTLILSLFAIAVAYKNEEYFTGVVFAAISAILTSWSIDLYVRSIIG